MQPLRPAARGRRGPPTTTIAESALLVFLLALLIVGVPFASRCPRRFESVAASREHADAVHDDEIHSQGEL